jgi:hypothetical protein
VRDGAESATLERLSGGLCGAHPRRLASLPASLAVPKRRRIPVNRQLQLGLLLVAAVGLLRCQDDPAVVVAAPGGAADDGGGASVASGGAPTSGAKGDGGAALDPAGGAASGEGGTALDLLDVPTLLEPPVVRALSEHPEIFVHPRLLFGPDDLDDLRRRALEDPTASSAFAALRSNAAELRQLPEFTQFGTAPDTVSLAAFRSVLNTDSTKMLTGTADGGFYGLLAAAAYVALVEQDSVAQAELAEVLIGAASRHATLYPQLQKYASGGDANADLAFCYDVLYAVLTEEQQATIRGLLAAMTSGRTVPGSASAPQVQSTAAHMQFDSLVLVALVIEGEPGYDPSLFDNNVAKLQSFSGQYGIHRAGYVHEDWGFFGLGMHQGSLSMLAASRRGHDFFSDTRLYQALLQPFHEAAPWSPGQLLGHGNGASFSVDEHGSAFYPVMGYMFPDSPLVDFILAQVHSDASDARQERVPLVEAMFGRPFESLAMGEVAATLRLPPTFFDPSHGIMIARSDFGPSATVVSFDCRMDTWDLGHVHADRNNLTLVALEREWFTDEGGPHEANAWHSTVLIDGVGQADAGGMPGKLLEFRHEAGFDFARGDASDAYRFSRQGNSGPLLTGHTWADFLFDPETPVEDWRTHAIRANAEFNPVEYAQRSVVLVRSDATFVVVRDDLKKDAATHDYEWTALLPSSIVAETLGEDLVLRHEQDMGPRDPRLLVRAVSVAGERNELGVETRHVALSSGQLGPARTLLIGASTSDAQFIVLLFPFRAGDPLPESLWTAASGELEVRGAGTDRIITFDSDTSAETETILLGVTAIP